MGRSASSKASASVSASASTYGTVDPGSRSLGVGDIGPLCKFSSVSKSVPACGWKLDDDDASDEPGEPRSDPAESRTWKEAVGSKDWIDVRSLANLVDGWHVVLNIHVDTPILLSWTGYLITWGGCRLFPRYPGMATTGALMSKSPAMSQTEVRKVFSSGWKDQGAYFRRLVRSAQ